jgi:hypothetical protein
MLLNILRLVGRKKAEVEVKQFAHDAVVSLTELKLLLQMNKISFL